MKKMTNSTQLSLFEETASTRKIRRPTGGSQNPIVFKDYDSFLAKFADNPKTTDDCYTPQDVYDAVLGYVGRISDMTDKVVLRPFFPGGDYETAEYPENGVVVDNPPFSIFQRIVRFYTTHGVPFFLFGNGMTIMSVCEHCTAVIVGVSLRFANGANVNVNFATNMLGDEVCRTAPELTEAIRLCPSQRTSDPLPKRAYPEELVSVSKMQTLAGRGEKLRIMRQDALVVKKLDRCDLFGNHLLVQPDKVRRDGRIIFSGRRETVLLSAREKRMLERLGERSS